VQNNLNKDYFIIENFINAKHAEDLINFFDENENLCADPEKEHKDRNIHYFSIKDKKIKSLLNFYAYKNILFINNTYKTKTQLWSEMRLCRWKPGHSMPIHIDKNIKTRDNNMDFSSLAYLNDDYEGGELIFTDEELKMPKFSCIIFESHLYPHGVKEVKKNNRYTIPSWYQYV
tara:strand:+ start:18 stop:539 length:522 start_codon:yes stop_codon:yes gene_type:complete